MTVAELIEKLSVYPADYDVRVKAYPCGECSGFETADVETAVIEAGGYVELRT